MKELLKLSHIFTEVPGNFQLQDFNLTIGSGEVIYVVADAEVEKYLIKDIMTGVIKDYSGSIYLYNSRQEKWSSEEAHNCGIFYVDERHQLVSKFTIIENVCVVKKISSGEIFINKYQQYKKTKEILDRIGLRREPDETIEEFSHFEKQLVCVAKMLYQGANVLIIDGLENKFSVREIQLMRRLAAILSSLDLALVFLQRQPTEMLTVCTKCVLMHGGSDVKVLFPPDITKETIAEYRLLHSQVGMKTQKEKGEQEKYITKKFTAAKRDGQEKKYSIIGYYDLGIDSKIHFGEYLQHLSEEVIRVSVDGMPLREIISKEKEVLIIGINSAQELLPNLNLGENLAFSFRHMEGDRKILMKHRLCSYLCMEFLMKFGINSGYRKLEELDYFERKLLSIYRWLQVGSRKTIILEEPYLNLHGSKIEQMQQYLKEISREYAPVGIFSKDAPEMIRICDAIVMSYNQRYIRFYDKAEFDQIIPEAAMIIDELN